MFQIEFPKDFILNKMLITIFKKLRLLNCVVSKRGY